MPILHTQYNGQGQAPDGSLVAIPPQLVLAARGPLVQVTIALAQSIAQQLVTQGQILPQPVSGLALLDTGASSTCIDEGVAQQLQLPVVDVVQIASASHAATPSNVYPIQLTIDGISFPIDAPRAVGAALATQGIIALIGRDVLQHGTLFYNGMSGEMTLAF